MFLVPVRMDGTSLCAPCAEPAVTLAPGRAWPQLPTRLTGPPRQQSSSLKPRLPGSADLHQPSRPLPLALAPGKFGVSVAYDAPEQQDAEGHGKGMRQGPHNPT